MKIKVFEKQIICEGKFLDYVKKDFEVNGKMEVYEMVERKFHNIAAVIVLTENNEIVLIRNYRIPLEEVVLELPAGMGDVEGESLENLARREMYEETGFVSDDMKFLFNTPTSQGMTSEIVSVFLAKNSVMKTKELELDEAEDIEVVVVPLDKFEDFLDVEIAKGTLIDPKIFYALRYVKNEIN